MTSVLSSSGIRTRFTDAYGLATPIALAGMGFVGTNPLAAAVSNAGGLGGIGVGMTPPPLLAQAITELKAATPGPFHVNFVSLFTTPEQIDVVAEAGAAIASFHFGHPAREWIDRLHAAGVHVAEQVGTADAARRAVNDGVDVVVAQGQEAGGHNYAALPLFALLPLVVDAVGEDAIVLGAGGIADGRGLAAALMLGADGAWVGTRFVATVEADAHEAYKQRLVAATGEETANTRIFGREAPRFNPFRVLTNGVVREWHERPADEVGEDLPVIGRTTVAGMEMPMQKFSFLIPTTATTGDIEEMALAAGQGVGLIGSVEPAGDVVASMTEQARSALGRYRGVVSA